MSKTAEIELFEVHLKNSFRKKGFAGTDSLANEGLPQDTIASVFVQIECGTHILPVIHWRDGHAKSLIRRLTFLAPPVAGNGLGVNVSGRERDLLELSIRK